jgi:integrase
VTPEDLSAATPLQVGRMLTDAAREGVVVDRALLPSRGQVLAWVLVAADPSPVEALGMVSAFLERRGTYGADAWRRLSGEMALFAARLDLEGAACLRDVTPEAAVRFVDEAVVQPGTGCWQEPSVSTRYLRRSAVRALFRTARQLGLCDHDPTLDLILPPRAAQGCRPLEDDEVVLCRLTAESTLFLTRVPAVWALAEATATPAEIAAVTADDIDLPAGVVHLPGAARRRPRTVELTDWSATHLAVRLARRDSDGPLVYDGHPAPGRATASISSALHELLKRSGLLEDPTVKPASVAGWRGRRELHRSGDIAAVANLLGLRSLDDAARAVGWDWQHQP